MRLRPWLPAIAYCAIIFALSARSEPPAFIPPALLSADKLLHAIEYAGLGALLFQGLLGSGVPPRRALLVAALLGSFFGATDEFHQWFVPGRNADVLDWVADTVGVTAGASLALLAHRWLRRPGGAG